MLKLTATTVALGTLLPSPLNARPIEHSAEDVADLIPSIRTVGLINPITVHALKKPKGKNGVLAGGRRWRALLELASDPAIDAAAIPVMLAEGTDAELRELSIMENEQREEMDEVTMLRSFGALRKADPKITDEQLGVNFGIGADQVRRIMRLAFLHPDILDAYQAKKIDRDVVRAFGATDDQARQLAVWEQVKDKQYIRAHEVRSALGFAAGYDVKAKVKLVGADAFLAAGGKLSVDMFSDAMSIAGEDILDRLFDKKVAGMVALYEAQHPKVKLTRDEADLPRGEYGGRDYQLQVNLDGTIPADKRERWSQLNERIEEIEQLLEEHIDNDAAEALQEADEDWEFPENLEDAPMVGSDEGGALITEIRAARVELAAIKPETGMPDEPLIGLYRVAEEGLKVDLYWPSREAAGLPPLARSTSRAAAGTQTSEAERQRRECGLTKDGMGAMLIVRRDMIRDQLTYDHELALDVLLYTQARVLLTPKAPSWSGGYVSFDGGQVGIIPPEPEDASSLKAPTKMRNMADTITRAPALDALVADIKADGCFTHHDAVEGFRLFRIRGDAFKANVACYLAGATMRGADTYYGDPQTPRFLEALANDELGRNAMWTDSVTYDEAFFALINHKKRVAILDAWGQGDAAKRLKSSESAAYCAKVYAACMDVYLSSHGESETVRKLLGISTEDQQDIITWRPDWFDTRQVKPLAAPKDAAPEPDDDGLDRATEDTIDAGVDDDDAALRDALFDGEGIEDDTLDPDHPAAVEKAAAEDARRRAAAVDDARGGGDRTHLDGGELAHQ